MLSHNRALVPANSPKVMLLVMACRQPGVIIAGQAQLSPSRLCSQPAAGLVSRANGPASLFSFLFSGISLHSAARICFPTRHRWAPLSRQCLPFSCRYPGSHSVGIGPSPCRLSTGNRASPGQSLNASGKPPQRDRPPALPHCATTALHKPPATGKTPERTSSACAQAGPATSTPARQA